MLPWVTKNPESVYMAGVLGVTGEQLLGSQRDGSGIRDECPILGEIGWGGCTWDGWEGKVLVGLLYIHLQQLCPGLGHHVPVSVAFGDAHESPWLELLSQLYHPCFHQSVCFSSTWLPRHDRFRKSGFRADLQHIFLTYTFVCSMWVPWEKILALLLRWTESLDRKMAEEDRDTFLL